MSEFVKFHRGGKMVAYEWKYDEAAKRGSYVPLDRPVGLNDLRVVVEVEPGVTLRDVMVAVEGAEDIMAFIGAYSWCGDIVDFHKLLREPFTPKADDEVSKLQVSAYGDLHSVHGKVKGKLPRKNKKRLRRALSFGMSTHFSGVGKDGMSYGMSLTPLNEMAHYPIEVDEKFVIIVDHRRRIKSERRLSLLEFLDAIYWEISFFGGPEEMKQAEREMHAAIEELQEEIANKGGQTYGKERI